MNLEQMPYFLFFPLLNPNYHGFFVFYQGDLLMNGPGKFYFGQDVFQHLFDGSALIQKFGISNGEVHYQCRYLRTKSFVQNIQKKAISRNEFATNASQDNNIHHKGLTGFTHIFAC